jgi:hypothetical protein
MSHFYNGRVVHTFIFVYKALAIVYVVVKALE